MRREEWDEVIDVHLDSFFILGRIFSKAMLSMRKGRIITIASLSGETGQAGQVNYSAAKAGLIGASKALARELGRRNILVNVVSPGLIETEMIAKLPLEQILPLIPLGRVGKVEEFVWLVISTIVEEKKTVAVTGPDKRILPQGNSFSPMKKAVLALWAVLLLCGVLTWPATPLQW